VLSFFPRIRAIPGGCFVAVCAILSLQTIVSQRLSLPERSLPAPSLEQIPFAFGSWQARGEDNLDRETMAALKPDRYILRNYTDSESGTVMNLFVAYFKSLQTAYGPHSPRICLPGAGWQVQSSRVGEVRDAGSAQAIPVNEYFVENARNRILVLYWYQNDRTAWAEEFRVKLRLLPDLIRYRRSDASLVRLITPVRGKSPEQELMQCREFARMMYPGLSNIFQAANSTNAVELVARP